MAEIPPGVQTKGQAAIEVAASLFTSDNLVILALTGIVIYSIYTFGKENADTVKEIVTFVAGGMVGYLGNQLKKAVPQG